LWSPDSKRIAFADIYGKLFVVTVADGSEVEVADDVYGQMFGYEWSPDSNHLVYRSGRDEKQGLWISDRFDSNAHRISEDGSDAFPRWSPDGTKIAFTSTRSRSFDVWVMDLDIDDLRAELGLPARPRK